MCKKIDRPIIDFIKKHHVLSLATVENNTPWSAACFYVWHNEASVFIYTSNHNTRHSQEALKNSTVAANIILETRIIGKIEGLQISGKTYPVTVEFEAQAKKQYLKKFPYAILADLNLWILAPNYLKLTNNKLGFGSKLIWQKD